MAVDSELVLGRGDGPPGLRFADRRHAARRGGLPDRGDDAPGDLDDAGHPAGQSAVERPGAPHEDPRRGRVRRDRKSTRLNSSHLVISYAVFCLKKKKKKKKYIYVIIISLKKNKKN